MAAGQVGTRTYLRYAQSHTFGCIASGDVIFVPPAMRVQPQQSALRGISSGRNANNSGIVLAAANEHIHAWHLRRGVCVATLDKDAEAAAVDASHRVSQVTVLAAPEDQTKGFIGAGYSDGAVRLWDGGGNLGEVVATFEGHRSAITALRFGRSDGESSVLLLRAGGSHNAQELSKTPVRDWDLDAFGTAAASGDSSMTAGNLLASGAADSTVVVWDLLERRGLFRLLGHKAAITDVAFSSRNEYLFSASKDTLVKVWALQTQHCVQTLVGHRSEVWSLDVSPDGSRLVTGCGDRYLRVWSLRKTEFAELQKAEIPANQSDKAATAEPVEEQEVVDAAVSIGELERADSVVERVQRIRFSANGALLGVSSADNKLELYEFYSHGSEQLKKRRKKRKSREKKKARQELQQQAHDKEKGDLDIADAQTLVRPFVADDEFSLRQVITSHGKVRSFAFSPDSTKRRPVICVCTASNRLELFQHVPGADGEQAGSKAKLLSASNQIELPGHRTDIRGVAISSDNSLIATCSSQAVKFWQTATRRCVGTVASGYGLCLCFAPGDRYVVLGTKSGELQVLHLATAMIVESIAAHKGCVWSLSLQPSRSGVVTGSADKRVKIWDFDMKTSNPEGEETGQGAGAGRPAQRLSLTQRRSIQMSDDVLSVRYSADGRYLSVSLLDSTVKVFFADTLKFYLSLYGHKLPVVALDMSFDGLLCATGGADKSVKIWGLDFGDCRKSIYAHEDNIMALSFVPKTHFFFTASRDKLVKYWDADSFMQILTLRGHAGPVWGLAVAQHAGSHNAFIVTCSSDRSIRIWERTDEALFLDSERQRELETRDIEEAGAQVRDSMLEAIGSELSAERAEQSASARAASGALGEASVDTGKTTLASMKAAERLIEALELATEERARLQRFEQLHAEFMERGGDSVAPQIDPASPLLLGRSASDHVLHTLLDIRSSDLEEALVSLPFSCVIEMLHWLSVWLGGGQQAAAVDAGIGATHPPAFRYADLAARTLFVLLRIHSNALVNNDALLDTLMSLRQSARTQLKRERDIAGYNLAAMRYLRSHMERTGATSGAGFFGDAIVAHRQKKRQRKSLI